MECRRLTTMLACPGVVEAVVVSLVRLAPSGPTLESVVPTSPRSRFAVEPASIRDRFSSIFKSFPRGELPMVRRFVRQSKNLLASAGLVVALAAGAAFTPATHAQFGGQSNFAEAFQPDFLPRDMVTFNDYLGLEEWQRPIVEMLMEDYNTSFRAGVEGVRDEMRAIAERLQGTSNEDVMDLVMGPVQTWMNDKRRLGEGFLENVRGQLSDRQNERWPDFERALRRDKELPRGTLSGESVNLVAILREMPLNAETRNNIQSVVDRYVVRLDSALVSRKDVMRAVEDDLAAAMRSMDFDTGLAANDRIMASRIAVRTVQDESALEIEQALPAEHRGDFRQRHRITAYAKAFRGVGQMERFFEGVLTLPELSGEQIASIELIRDTYNDRVTMINESIVNAIRTEEPLDARRRTEMIRARHNGTAPPTREQSESSKLIAEREAAGDEARRAVLELLTEEQKTALPSVTRTAMTPEQAAERRREAMERRGAEGGAKLDPQTRLEQHRRDMESKHRPKRDPATGVGTSGGSETQRGVGERPRRTAD